MNNAVTLRNISKSFGHNVVLKDVNIEVRQGTVHALVGENGAGKSTLLNIVHGVYPEYGGQVEVLGDVVHLKSPIEAIRAGVSKVHQEVHIARELTVGENIALGSEPSRFGFVDRSDLYRRTDGILDRLGCTFRSTHRAGSLSVGQLQMMAIAKSLFHGSSVISFDEPTASLSDRESEILFRVIADLKASGITIIYVSHRLDEVMELSDGITILRDGAAMGTWKRGELTKSAMIEKMVGRHLSAVLARASQHVPTGDPLLMRATRLSGPGFEDVSFDLREGEILGFAGLVGAGRTEVMEALFGARPLRAGTVDIRGTVAKIHTPQDAMRHGLALIPEDRKRDGFVANLDNKMNMFLPQLGKKENFILNQGRIVRNFDRYREVMNIHPNDPDYQTVQLSGGNQQKVILGKWLGTRPTILILDEPTKGIDVGAKAEIYRLIQELSDEGLGVIVVSSELPELLALCHRVVVMREGRQMAQLPNEGLDEKTVLHYAMGGAS